MDQAMGKGYQPRVHRAEDNVEEKRKYADKNLKDQNWALGRFET